jgi:ABC-2 type transport system ATP-binding protein
MRQAVATQELTKYYSRGAVRALQQVNLNVEPGRIFSLLGPNGAGKTTLIKILIGLLHPTSGGAEILGTSVSDEKIHTRIGYLAENHRFPEFLTARQVLYYFGKMSGVDKSILVTRIPELLSLVKMEKWGDVKVKKFSKGMVQRIGLAHALINDPDLVFLDEPTDGIDPVGRREIRDVLKALRNQGKTVFLNSHLLSEVERVSDEIAILKEGKLLQQGPVDAFISVHQQYQIRAEEGHEKIKDICLGRSIPMTIENGLYNITVKDDMELNHLIDQLRQNKVILQAIIPRKISLEDFFIQTIEEKGEAQN